MGIPTTDILSGSGPGDPHWIVVDGYFIVTLPRCASSVLVIVVRLYRLGVRHLCCLCILSHTTTYLMSVLLNELHNIVFLSCQIDFCEVNEILRFNSTILFFISKFMSFFSGHVPHGGVLPCRRYFAQACVAFLPAEWIPMLTDCTSVSVTLSQLVRGRRRPNVKISGCFKEPLSANRL